MFGIQAVYFKSNVTVPRFLKHIKYPKSLIFLQHMSAYRRPFHRFRGDIPFSKFSNTQQPTPLYPKPLRAGSDWNRRAQQVTFVVGIARNTHPIAPGILAPVTAVFKFNRSPNFRLAARRPGRSRSCVSINKIPKESRSSRRPRQPCIHRADPAKRWRQYPA